MVEAQFKFSNEFLLLAACRMTISGPVLARDYRPFDFRSTYKKDKMILKFIGVYPGSSAATTKSMLIYVKRIFDFLMWILFIVSMLLFVFINRSDTVKVSKTLYICLTFICSLIKTINFTINIRKLSSLEDLLDNKIFYDKTHFSMMQRDIKKTQKKMNVYRFLAIITVMIHFTATPLLANSGEYRLAIACYTPWDINRTLNYVPTLLFEGVSTATAGYMNIVVETLFANFCTIACAELRALKRNLGSLDYSPANVHIKSELNRNIVLHKEIIKLTEAIENVFSYGILGQFATAIVIICFAGFRLLTSPSSIQDENFGTIENFSETFGHLVFVVVQVSIYCIYGHQIMVESSDINEAIYLSNWYVAHSHVRKDLIIIRECCKRPIILRAGKLLPLTVDTLVMWNHNFTPRLLEGTSNNTIFLYQYCIRPIFFNKHNWRPLGGKNILNDAPSSENVANRHSVGKRLGREQILRSSYSFFAVMRQMN